MAEHGYRIGFVVIPGFSMLALSAALEPLRSANRVLGHQRYVWNVVGQQPGPVAASNGLELRTTLGIAEAPPADLVVVVASLGIETFRSRRLFAFLRSLRNQHRLIGAIGSGALILARAGLLRGRRVAIYSEMRPRLAEEFPDVEVTDTLFCWDDDVLSSAGGAAAMDLMLELIAMRDGRAAASDVAKLYQRGGPVRPSGAARRQATGWRHGVTDRRIEVAVRLMEERIAEPLKIAGVAEAAGLSERQLERLFAASFGKSPSQFYMELRLQAAQARLLGSTDTLEEIAESLGFSSQAHFSHAVKAWAGTPPLAIRKRRRRGSVGSMQKKDGTM